MPFDGKCKVMHIRSANQAFSFHTNGNLLNSTQVERDLGVHIDSLLKFRQRAAAAIAKANRVLAVIRHSFALINEATLPLLYKALKSVRTYRVREPRLWTI